MCVRIPQGMPQLPDTPRECRLADRGLRPHSVHEVVLGHQLPGLRQQAAQHGKGFGCEPQHRVPVPQTLIRQDPGERAQIPAPVTLPLSTSWAHRISKTFPRKIQGLSEDSTDLMTLDWYPLMRVRLYLRPVPRERYGILPSTPPERNGRCRNLVSAVAWLLPQAWHEATRRRASYV